MNTNVINVRFFMRAALVLLVFGSAGARSDEAFVRSTDNQVKKLIKTITEGERQFVKTMDGKFKDSILRGANGEVDVKKYLQDFDQALKSLGNRFDDKYSASAEVGDVLTRASAMHSYVREHPQMKGASEWDQVAANLSRLATDYGVTFPLAAGAAVRRIGDRELLESIDAAGKLPGSIRKALQKAAKNTPALASVSTSGTKDLEALSDALQTLKSRLSSDKPATAQARQVIVVGDRFDALVRGVGVPGSVLSEWQPANQYLDTIARAFAIPRTAA